MANDIALLKSELPIKNGSAVVTCSRTGYASKSNTYVKNTPTITNIQSKFDNRFDDPSYYYGTGNSTVVGG